MSYTWEELKEEYSNDQFPPFGGPFTDALDPWEWLSKNFDPPKRTEFSGSYMKQTAVEWLVDKVTDMIHESNHIELVSLLEQAKQMEKEQIINAYKNGQKIVEQYYNETYGK